MTSVWNEASETLSGNDISGSSGNWLQNLGTTTPGVKARPDFPQLPVESFVAQAHQARTVGPNERAGDSTVWKNLCRSHPVQCHLCEINGWHICLMCGCRT